MYERIERCETCKWWENFHANEEWGNCHRHPPMLCETAVEFYKDNPDEDEKHDYVEQDLLAVLRGPNPWVQPVTMLDDFCGEWKPKQTEEIKDVRLQSQLDT